VLFTLIFILTLYKKIYRQNLH